jgi:hypothetical protein
MLAYPSVYNVAQQKRIACGKRIHTIRVSSLSESMKLNRFILLV